MVIRLKLLIKNSDAIPELRVANILQTIERLLVCIESSVYIVTEQVAVADGSPAWPVLRVDLRHFVIVLDRSAIVTLRSVELGHLAVVLE